MRSCPKPAISTIVFLSLIALPLTNQAFSADIEYATETSIPYRTGADLDANTRTMCVVDLYHPTNRTDFATIVWFHGGGLTGGKRSVPAAFKREGVAVVAVEYRLSPTVSANTCIDDAAAAVAWTFKNIAKYGCSTEKIFVSGHSAGGYLTSMVGLDKARLAKHDVDADDIAGLIPYSGHTITHFTVRKERGIAGTQPIIDDMAPLFHVRNDCPPTLLITGDRELEMLGRYEENAYFWRMMQVVKHPNCELYELDGYDHGGMAEPAHPLLLNFVRQIASE